MSRAQSVLILGGLLALAAFPAPAEDRAGEVRLLFTGDILLSRQVRRQMEQTGRSPWEGFGDLFRRADWVLGNLEGAASDPEQCLPRDASSPCFAIPPESIPLLAQAGFRALGLANNHALDLGAAGRDATREALRKAGLDALSWEDSPAFFKLAGYQVAVIAISTVAARDSSRAVIPSTSLVQKLRLARQLADVVIVFIHWGSELLDWPDREQRRAAAWLVGHGADLIVGHHPHVIQAAECLERRPVFYSLGNHVFDQKYPASKQGLIADCRIRDGVLRCAGIATETPPGSAFPRLAAGAEGGEPATTTTSGALEACAVRLAPPATVAGFTLRAGAARADSRDQGRAIVIEGWRAGGRAWRSRPLPLVSAQVGRLEAGGPNLLITLERHPSSIDGEEGVRPYVYEVGASGLFARWRGSALAWPLVDAALLPGGNGVLCALHRRDSFLVLEPGAAGVRVAVYAWSGFGFHGVDDPATLARCEALLAGGGVDAGR